MNSTCPICRREARLELKTRDYNRRISEGSFLYYSCPACFLIFLDPIPSDLAKFYSGGYYSLPSSLADLEESLAQTSYKIEIVQQFARSGRFLEIGPGRGDLALMAKRAGFDVQTIEMDPACCAFLSSEIGVGAVCTAEPLAALRGMALFDVIALWHVIEHLKDCSEVLGAIASALKPSGVAVIAAPNPRAFQFRVLRGKWAHVDAPRHLALPPLALLVKLAQDLGLTPLWSTTRDRGARGWNRFGWEQSLGNLADSPRAKARLRRLGRWASRLATPLDRFPGLGSAYTVVFRKRQPATS
jgi:SAM-dependent methyltransferase